MTLLIAPRTHDLGGLQVHRVVPTLQARSVGPFVFVDHMGPVLFEPGRGIDVRPHPHIGLATVTYLWAGALRHRDTLGSVQDILPGDVNWMTAGRGIAHSERTPDAERATGQAMLGLQSWIALPADKEEIAPGFQHYPADDLPVVHDTGMTARIIAGSALGKTSPVAMVSPWFYVEATLAAGRSLPLDADHEERAVYLVDGAVQVAGDGFTAPALLIFRPGDRITVTATQDAKLMLLGGTALEGPRHIWWNFVSSRRERIEQAKADWKAGRFPPVPGETEFIPLPER